MAGVSRRAHRGGPNDAQLFRRWQISHDPNVCVMNGLDVSSIVPIGIDRKLVSADALAQATGTKQALLNNKDAGLANRPSIEFADAEVYQTANNVALPAQMTLVVVAEDGNGGAFSVLSEHTPNYVIQGGLVLYVNGNNVLRSGFNYTSWAERVHTSTPTRFVWLATFDPAIAGLGAIPKSKINDANHTVNGGGSNVSGSWHPTAHLQLGGREATLAQLWVGGFAVQSIYTGLFSDAQATAEFNYWRAEYAI